jgi:hypothetical protein
MYMLCNECLSFLITDERRLHQAASTNNVNLMQTLLHSGVNPNCKDALSRSSLHLAACRGYHDIVRFVSFYKHPLCMYKGYLENNFCLLWTSKEGVEKSLHMTHCLVNHHIIGQLVFVLVSTMWVIMCPVVDDPVSCKFALLFPYFHAKTLIMNYWIMCSLWHTATWNLYLW